MKDAERFKDALIEVDMKYLNEEIIVIIQENLPEESIFKKLRETPPEKFADAPDGEKVCLILGFLSIPVLSVGFPILFL